MNTSDLSLRRRLENAWGSQQCEYLKAWHSWLHGRNQGNEEFGVFWSESDETVWGHSFGRMRGFDEIYYNSVTTYDADCYRTYLMLYPHFPELGGKDPRTWTSAGIHALCSDIIEVAADGYSCRMSYLTPGGGGGCDIFPPPRELEENRNGPEPAGLELLWERYGADFVKEDGQWKYLREIVCPDVNSCTAAKNWGMEQYGIVTGEKSAHEHVFDDLRLAEAFQLHRKWTPITPPQDTVPYPEPYETLDPENSYAPFLDYEKFKSTRGTSPRASQQWYTNNSTH